MFGHHASKAAANMAGRLLSFDLKKEGVVVGAGISSRCAIKVQS